MLRAPAPPPGVKKVFAARRFAALCRQIAQFVNQFDGLGEEEPSLIASVIKGK